MRSLAVALLTLIPAFAAVEVDKGKSFGKPDAPLMMEVYSCFTCPHCKAFHDQIVPQLMRDYVNTGKLYLVNRDFPLNNPDHRHCREAHVWANAAARIGKYEAVTDKLWATQSAWAASGKIWETIAPVLSPEEQKKVQALAKDPSVTGEVEREFNAGVAAGVGSTPTLFITKAGRRIPVSSVEGYTFLKSLLDSLLK